MSTALADTSGSNRLTVLAAEIREAHDDVGRASKYSAERAVDAGRMLAEAKADESIPRGGWDRWVEEVAGVPKTTAYYYLKLFIATEEGRSTLNDIAEAGQIGALKAAAELAEENTAEPKPPAEWTQDQLDRKARAEAGECVVANMHDGADEALIAWAEAAERFVRIDRRTEWGNPFEMPQDGERPEVVGKFMMFYWPHKDGLLDQIPSLPGKVLGCWCHPEECHGHIIAATVNRVAAGELICEVTEEFAASEGCCGK